MNIRIVILILISSSSYGQIANKLLIQDKKSSGLNVYSKDALITFGDSWTTGQQSSVPALAYAKLLQAYIGGSHTNYAAGGRGLWLMAQQANVNITNLTSGVITSMAGLNDYRRSGTNTKTDNKMVGALRVLMINAFAKTFYNNSGGTGWTETGTWGAAAITGAKNTTRNAQGVATMSKTISGKNFGFVFIGSDGTQAYGAVTIKIDGTTYVNNVSLNNTTDGISDGTVNNQTSPYAFCVFGLSAGNHTIEIDASAANVPFDYVAELSDPTTDYMNKVLVSEIPHLTATGYATAPANANDAIIDAANVLLNTTANEFINTGYMVKVMKINQRVSTSDFYTDGIHPIDIGHQHIFEGFRDLINLLTTVRVFPNLSSVAFGGTYYQGRHASPWGAFGGSDISLPANTAGWVQAFVPNTTDCDYGMLGLNTTKEVATYTSYEYAGCYYNAPQALYSLTNGASFTSRQAGALAVGSKWRVERTSGMVIKLRYASDGINFSDVYTWPGTNSAQLYLNICFDATNKIAYNIETSGFY